MVHLAEGASMVTNDPNASLKGVEGVPIWRPFKPKRYANISFIYLLCLNYAGEIWL
jgi:hypothetical protein